MKKLSLIVILFLAFSQVKAQDLNARVQILSPQLQLTNKRILDILQSSITDFLNNRKWTNDELLPQERIDCNFIINISDWDGASNFKAEAQIQSSRPVYGTTYNSTILNSSDKEFSFSYTEGQPLDFSDQRFTSNLSSLLAYYAYIIVGLDYDTFSAFGGNPYFTKAQMVVNNAQNAPFSGWKASESLRNRYWLIENLNNKAFAPLRQVLYDYHRNGLDVMISDQQAARQQILAALPQLQKIDKQKQGSMLSQLFFTAKSAELVNLIMPADEQQKAKAYSILASLDPANLSKYESLKKGK